MSLSLIHRFVPGEGPVLLLLHGTGGTEDDLLELGRYMHPGAALLSPRGQVMEHGISPRFFRRLEEGVFDEEDLILRTHELADFVTEAATEYGFDVNRVLAMGYSNGANIAASTLLLRPGTLCGAALLRAMVPLVPETLPDLGGRPVFLAAGRHDAIIPVQNTERLAGMLREAGANVNVFWSTGGHQLSSADMEAARLWMTEKFPR